jgi:hypothetical protein
VITADPSPDAEVLDVLPRPRTRGLVVGSAPADDVYVRHLAPVEGAGPRRVAVAGLVAWAATAELDVFHLHAGLDDRVSDPVALVAALRRRSTPLVVTIHDLSDPRLDVLAPAADALVVLTGEAAEQVRRRWGREALPVAHPHVVPLQVVQRASSMRDVRRRGGRALQFRVGVAAFGRRSTAHQQLTTATSDVLLQVGGTTVQVDGLADLDRNEALWTRLASLDALVLPQRLPRAHTWLEACRDLGTTVVSPIDLLPAQAPALTYVLDGDELDGASLGSALREVHGGRVPAPVGVELRRRQRAAIAAVHARLYGSVASRAATTGGVSSAG